MIPDGNGDGQATAREMRPDVRTGGRGGDIVGEVGIGTARPAGAGIVDADVHCTVPSAAALFPYLADHWVEQIRQSGFSGASENAYPPGIPTSARPGSAPGDGRPAGSDLDVLRTQVLDVDGVEAAILNCAYAVDTIRNPDAASAIASAVNDWQLAEWLEVEPRLHGSLVVPSQIPELAVAEIERLGDDPRFVQVFLPARSAVPYGRRDFHKVLAAAVERDLVVSLQYGGFPGNPPTAVGWPSYHIEEYVGMASVMQSQLMNLIAEGVFDAFGDLRVSLVEGGFTWLPSFLWRFDKDWKGLRREVPWVRRPPSEYVHDHVRLTTAPLDLDTHRPEAFATLFAQVGGADVLMYASDHPHLHADTGDDWTSMLPEDARAPVLGDNARAFYRLNR